MSERGNRSERTNGSEPGSRSQGSGFGVQGSGRKNESFLLVPSPAEYRDDSAMVVRLPPGVRSKQKLLAILADKLRFPGYFGGNWDALEECLADFSWLPAGQRVAIVHEDLPFGAGGENRGIYLSVLAGACGAALRSHPLSFVFPSSLAEDITAAMSQESVSPT